MKRLAVILIVVTLVLSGCTPIPASSENGIQSNAGNKVFSNKTDEVEAENQKLKEQLDEAQKKLDEMENNFDGAKDNNNAILQKLNETEALLKSLRDGTNVFPDLKSEATEADDISKYLKEQSKKMDKSNKKIELIPLENKSDMFLFDTVGYAEEYNQLFIWQAGKKEPKMIDDAYYGKGGSRQWLVQDKYMMLETVKSDLTEKKIVDIDNQKVVSVFETKANKIYLIPNTATLMMQSEKENETEIVLYDFLTGEEKTVNLPMKNSKYNFEVNEKDSTIKFTGTFVNEDSLEYTAESVSTIEKIKEVYKIKTLEESKKAKNPVAQDDTDSEEKPAAENKTDGENI